MTTIADLPPAPSGRSGWPWTEAAPPTPPTMLDGSPWPRLSVVTPSFNQAAFLEETIRSVLLQGYPNLEYCVMDGGSTDGSVELIRKYAHLLTDWVSEPDRGQTEAINKGLRQATGDIFAWLNSDDVYEPGALTQASDALRRSPEAGLVYSDCHYIDALGRPLQTVRAWEFRPRRLLTGIPLVIQPASFFTRRAWDKTGQLDEALQYVFDHDFYVRLALAGFTLKRVEAVWARFRLHAGSKTWTQWIKFNQELQRIVERTYAHPSSVAQRAWRAEGLANVYQWLGEAYLKNGQEAAARQMLIKALAVKPLWAKTPMALALWVDALLGTRLHVLLRRLRYRLPDAPPGATPLEDFTQQA